MARPNEIQFSLTETEQFRRLVDFVFAVNQHAQDMDDDTLSDMLTALRDDLFDMNIGA